MDTTLLQTARPPRSPAATDDPIAEAPLSESLRVLARAGTLRTLRKGTLLISEGDVGDTLYIVLRGRLRAFGIGGDAREVTYGNYGPGESVGEMGLDGGPRSANVEATEPTLCVVVARLTLQRHLLAHPEFAFELLSRVIRRARDATVSLKRIALNAVYGRLKELLESLAVPQGDGSALIDPAPSHAEIAQSLGCGREMISRVMKDLERGGTVQVGRRRIVVMKALPSRW